MVHPERAQFKNLPGNQRAIGMYLDRLAGRHVIVISGNLFWPPEAWFKWHLRMRIKINVQPILDGSRDEMRNAGCALNPFLLYQSIAGCPDKPLNPAFSDRLAESPDCGENDSADLLIVRENPHFYRRAGSCRKRPYLILSKLGSFKHRGTDAEEDQVDQFIVLHDGLATIEGGNRNDERSALHMAQRRIGMFFAIAASNYFQLVPDFPNQL